MNAARYKAGKGPVGFINPTLWSASSAAYYNDITSGNNKCCRSGAGCCQIGFEATKGWDPASGK